MSSGYAVMGVVANHLQAQVVVDGLHASGFAHEDISALLPVTEGSSDFTLEEHNKGPEGAVAGVSAGGALGGTLGLLVGVGAIAIPGFALLVAAGPILAALSGMAVGGTVGGMTGGLIGMGIPEMEAKEFEKRVHDGHILLSVHVLDRERAALARATLLRLGATDIVSTGSAELE